MSVARALSILLVSLAPLSALGCSNDAVCHAGEPCDCSNANTCYFECSGDGCDMTCKGLVTCGAVCDNDCSLECHDVTECGASCGDNCTILCHNLDDCGAICGAGCDYECHDAAKCGVRAGSQSIIECNNAPSCHVDCQGSCQVHCGGGVPDCLVRCSGGGDPNDCGGGILACGSCP